MKEKLSAIEEAIHQTKVEASQDVLNFTPKLDNQLVGLLGVVESADARPTDGAVLRYGELRADLDRQLAALKGVFAGELAAFVEQHRANEAAGLAAQPAGHLYFQPVTQLEISATQIRKRLAAGDSARYLMPLAALDIIEREGLYRDHEERRT